MYALYIFFSECAVKTIIFVVCNKTLIFVSNVFWRSQVRESHHCRSSHPEELRKKVFRKILQNSQENINFGKKEILTQVFSCESCIVLEHFFRK